MIFVNTIQDLEQAIQILLVQIMRLKSAMTQLGKERSNLAMLMYIFHRPLSKAWRFHGCISETIHLLMPTVFQNTLKKLLYNLRFTLQTLEKLSMCIIQCSIDLMLIIELSCNC